MGYLLERKAQVIFVTASSVKDNGKKHKIIIESRPEFAIVRLAGSRQRFPLSWEMIYEVAKRHHAHNIRLEAEAVKPRKPRKIRLTD
jgi:hypothetical protein